MSIGDFFMAKRKTAQEEIAQMTTIERIEIVKKLTDRVTDHLLYVLELHETNRIVCTRRCYPPKFQPHMQGMLS